MTRYINTHIHLEITLYKIENGVHDAKNQIN